MKKHIAILLFSLYITACISQPAIQKGDSTLAMQRVREYQIVTVTAETVYIRNQEGEVTSLVAEQGYRLVGNVQGDWFVLLSGERVFLGCTDFDTEKGCQSE